MSDTTRTRTAEAVALLQREEHEGAVSQARRWSSSRSDLATNLYYEFRSICRREGIEDYFQAVDWYELTFSFRPY